MRRYPYQNISGFTLIEVLITLSIGSFLIVLLGGVVNQALESKTIIHEQNDLTRQARFAMQQMITAVTTTRLLLLPMKDKPGTFFSESIREQTIPPSPGYEKVTAVLAVTLPSSFDLDGDGFPDADNDKDGLIDEDLPNDAFNNGVAGIIGIDDNGDGDVDGNSFGILALLLYKSSDDDESGEIFVNEDSFNGKDDDGDGNIDEDPAEDNNYDGCPGVCFVDDDHDGEVDEGNSNDDDEDGVSNEDWYDPIVFYVDGQNLLQRTPVPWDVNASGTITGLDYIEEIIATNISHLRIERNPQNNDQTETIDIYLELTGPLTGAKFSLNNRIRVGTRL